MPRFERDAVALLEEEEQAILEVMIEEEQEVIAANTTPGLRDRRDDVCVLDYELIRVMTMNSWIRHLVIAPLSRMSIELACRWQEYEPAEGVAFDDVAFAISYGEIGLSRGSLESKLATIGERIARCENLRAVTVMGESGMTYDPMYYPILRSIGGREQIDTVIFENTPFSFNREGFRCLLQNTTHVEFIHCVFESDDVIRRNGGLSRVTTIRFEGCTWDAIEHWDFMLLLNCFDGLTILEFRDCELPDIAMNRLRALGSQLVLLFDNIRILG